MRAIRFLLAFLLVFTAGSAMSETPPRPTGEAAITYAITWLNENSDYHSIPPVRFWVSLKPDAMGAQAIKFGAPGDHRKVYAIFNCTTRTMYLRDDADYNNPAVLSFVAHETVHHAQCESNRPFSVGNMCELETEAYRLQAQFLRSTVVEMMFRGPFASAYDIQQFERAAAELDTYGAKACEVMKSR